MIKTSYCHTSCIQTQKDLYAWTVNGFKWVKKLSERNSIEFNGYLIKDYDKNSNMGYFLEVDV